MLTHILQASTYVFIATALAENPEFNTWDPSGGCFKNALWGLINLFLNINVLSNFFKFAQQSTSMSGMIFFQKSWFQIPWKFQPRGLQFIHENC